MNSLCILEEKWDLIVSNATLQWFHRPVEGLSFARKALSSSGILLMSTFGADTFRELQVSFEKAYEQCGLHFVPHFHPYPKECFGLQTCEMLQMRGLLPSWRPFFLNIQK